VLGQIAPRGNPPPGKHGQPFSIGKIPPTPGLLDRYFNDSSGEADEGQTDARGPWNEGGDWQIVEVPELREGVENMEKPQGEDSGRGMKQRISSSESRTRKSA
jgi:hypothetical protein